MNSLEELISKVSGKNIAIEGLPEKLYHAYPAMSASGMKEFRKSPGHFKWMRENPSEDTPARIVGRAFHMAIGEPDRFLKEVVMIDGHRGTKSVKEAVEAAECEGKTVLKPDQHKLITDSVAYCLEHPLIKEIIKQGKSEVSYFWIDPDTGVPCKARLDWVTANGVLVDWKTFDGLHDDDNIERQIRKMFYQFQASWYLEAYFRVHGKMPRKFYNVFVESEPCTAKVTTIAQQSLEETVPYIQHYLKRFAECLKSDSWPLDDGDVVEIVVKQFA